MERSGKMTIEEVLAVEEMQVFDRKSVNIAPKVLAIPIIAFANAIIGIANTLGAILTLFLSNTCISSTANTSSIVILPLLSIHVFYL